MSDQDNGKEIPRGVWIPIKTDIPDPSKLDGRHAPEVEYIFEGDSEFLASHVSAVEPRMIEVKTADLEGVALDWAVAKAQDYKPCLIEDDIGTPYWAVMARGDFYLSNDGRSPVWSPSSDWNQGGPLIAAHGIGIQKDSDSCWVATDEWHVAFEAFTADQDGKTPLIAACRVIVASALGDTVMVPKELMP